MFGLIARFEKLNNFAFFRRKGKFLVREKFTFSAEALSRLGLWPYGVFWDCDRPEAGERLRYLELR
jgi:hypothetical protein